MKTSLRRLGTAAVASGALALTAALTLAGPASASTASASTASASTQSAGGYQFRTLNDARDLTFNQLLGINNEGVIAGYFGSGAKGHPNKGYQLFPAYGQGNYLNENFPGSRQTQVTGLNDLGVTVGFWSTQNNANMVNNNFGFYSRERPVPHRELPDRQQRQPAGRPAAGRQRPRRGGRFLHQRAGQQPRLHLQHPDPLVHPGAGARRSGRRGRPEPDRDRDQQLRRRGRLLRQELVARPTRSSCCTTGTSSRWPCRGPR